MYRKRIGENKGISLILSTLRKIKAGCQQSQEGIEGKFVPDLPKLFTTSSNVQRFYQRISIEIIGLPYRKTNQSRRSIEFPSSGGKPGAYFL